jgi:hypothetical protein
MLAQGTDLYVVSEVLGHSSIAITKDVYGHLVEGQKRAAATRMSEAQWLPQWFPEPARTGRGRWLRQKKTLTMENTGAPGGIRTPTF